MSAAENHKKSSFLLRRPWRALTRRGVPASHPVDSAASTAINAPNIHVNRGNRSRSIIGSWLFTRRELTGATPVSLPSSTLRHGLGVADHITQGPVPQPLNPEGAHICRSSPSSPGLAVDVLTIEDPQPNDPLAVATVPVATDIGVHVSPVPVARPASAPSLKSPDQVTTQGATPDPAGSHMRPQRPLQSLSPHSPVFPTTSCPSPHLQPVLVTALASQSSAAAVSNSSMSRSLSIRGQASSLSGQIAHSGAQNDIFRTVDTLQQAFEHAKRRQRTFKNRHGEEVIISERIAQILKGMEDYAKIVDVAIQHHPEVTALIWAGVRSILMIALYRVELLDNLELAMGTIVETMAIGEFYNRIYATTPWSAQVLSSPAATMALRSLFETALQDLYDAIQSFATKAVEYVDPDSSAIQRFGNVFKPFAVVMKPLIDAISEKKSTLRACAEMATMKSTQEMAQSMKGLECTVESIKNLMASMSNLDDILGAATETLTIANELKTITTGNMDLTTQVMATATETRELATRALDTITTEVLDVGTKSFNKAEEIFTLTTENVRTAEQTLDLVTSNANIATQNLVVTKRVHEVVLGVESRVEALVTHQHQTLFKEKSLEIELQELKTDYLATQELMEEFNLDLYIPAKGMTNPHDKPSRHFDLAQKIHLFLAPQMPEKVCLLHGMAGSGKSTFNHSLARTLWEAFDGAPGTDKSQWSIPVFITLASLHNPNLHNQDLIASYFHARGMSDAHIQKLRQTRRFVFILDGYDEIENRDCNFYLNNKLAEWQAKIVVTSRPEYLGAGYRSKFHPPGESHLLQEYWIAPFGTAAIEEYIDRYVRAKPSLRSVADYQELIARPEVAELISNPFLLRMVMAVEPSEDNLKRGTLYKQFVEHWFEQAQNRLQNIQLSATQRSAFNQLDDEGFTSHAHQFCQQFAVTLYRCQSIIATYDASIDQSYNAHAVHATSPQNALWKPFLANVDNQTRLLRFSSPLARNQQSYRFIHKSIRDYLVAQAMWVDSSMATGGREALFNEFNIVRDPGVIDFIIERASEDEALRQHCQAYIQRCKIDDKVQRAAANAITILVRAGRSFAGCDLSGVRIPGADLSGGWFDGTSLRGANLAGVTMHSAWLRVADLSSAMLEGVSFGERPCITTNYDSGSFRFSPDGSLCAIISRTIDGGEATYGIDIWSRSDQRRVCQIPVLRHPTKRGSAGLSAIEFSPDGIELVTAGADERIYLFSLQADIAQLVHTFTAVGLFHRVKYMAYGPSGGVIASAYDDHRIRLWSKSDRKLLHTSKGSGSLSAFRDLKFCPSGDLLASCHDDFSVRVWSAENLVPIHQFHTKGGGCLNMVAFSPDGRLLAVSGYLPAVRIWSVESKKQWHLLTHEAAEVITRVAFSPDGQLLATDTAGNAVHLWSLKHKRVVYTYAGKFGDISVLAFSPDSQTLAIGNGKQKMVRLLTVPHGLEQDTGPRKGSTENHDASIKCLRFSPDGTLLVCCSSTSSGQKVPRRHFGRLWSLASEASPSLPLVLPHARTVAFPSDDLLSILEYQDKSTAMHLCSAHVQLGSNKQPRLEMMCNRETTTVLDMPVFSNQGKLLVSCPEHSSGRITLCSVEVPTAPKILEANPNDGVHGDCFTCPVFSPDDRFLAAWSTAAAATRVFLWSMPDGNLFCDFEGHTETITAMALCRSAVGNILACAGDREVKMWCVEETQCSLLWTIQVDSEMRRACTIGFSSDGCLLAVVECVREDRDRTSLRVRIWSIASQSILATERLGEGDVVALAWGTGDKIDQLAIGMDTGVVQCWHVRKVLGKQGFDGGDAVHVTAVWASQVTQVELTGAKLAGVTGLDPLNRTLLEQKGVLGLGDGEDQVGSSEPADEEMNTLGSEGQRGASLEEEVGGEEEEKEWDERSDESAGTYVFPDDSTDSEEGGDESG